MGDRKSYIFPCPNRIQRWSKSRSVWASTPENVRPTEKQAHWLITWHLCSLSLAPNKPAVLHNTNLLHFYTTNWIGCCLDGSFLIKMHCYTVAEWLFTGQNQRVLNPQVSILVSRYGSVPSFNVSMWDYFTLVELLVVFKCIVKSSKQLTLNQLFLYKSQKHDHVEENDKFCHVKATLLL